MRVAIAVVLAVLAPGCDRVFGLDRPLDAAPEPDAPPPDARLCFGAGTLTVCLKAAPTMRFSVEGGTTTTVDTTASQGCEEYTGSQDDLCVISATSFELDGTLIAKGSRPLVLVTPGTITIGAAAKLDLAGGFLAPGAGSPAMDCVLPSQAMMSGGGGGGSFGSAGGNGGPGNGGSGGAAAAPMVATRLRAGCNGRTGANSGATPGRGGGALALIASAIRIEGVVTASGTRGFGGAGNSNPGRGGGGGGSGGMIVLDAPMIVLGSSALVIANGGGGGEGGGDPAPGRDGADPTSATAAAVGGSGGSLGGDGGDGAFGTTAAKTGGTGAPPTGGGGGGGGVGVIVIVPPRDVTGAISPPRQL